MPVDRIRTYLRNFLKSQAEVMWSDFWNNVMSSNGTHESNNTHVYARPTRLFSPSKTCVEHRVRRGMNDPVMSKELLTA